MHVADAHEVARLISERVPMLHAHGSDRVQLAQRSGDVILIDVARSLVRLPGVLDVLQQLVEDVRPFGRFDAAVDRQELLDRFANLGLLLPSAPRGGLHGDGAHITP